LEEAGVYGRTIKIDVKEIGWDGVEWINLPVDRDKWWEER
jgi:hypothetical protein